MVLFEAPLRPYDLVFLSWYLSFHDRMYLYSAIHVAEVQLRIGPPLAHFRAKLACDHPKLAISTLRISYLDFDCVFVFAIVGRPALY